MKPLTPHWADQTAVRIVGVWGDRDLYTVASGITPSGVVHIGNFREVITAEFVARALRDIGKKVRFIYSWDDFDTFRKVPKNLPNQEMLATYLRQPISRVPDPYGIETSYAASNIRRFEDELKAVGIEPEYLYQHRRYGSGLYAESIRQSLENRNEIRAILDQFRKEPLEANWLPTAIYCEKCNRDEMIYERYDGDWDYSYHCKSCDQKTTTDIRKTANLKLNWRTDWPMRWAFEAVDFEPGGKDHSSDGGSFDTARQIVKAVWDREAPQYLQYDFVSIKGGTGKMSSSSGVLFTLSDAFDVYEPQMVRWIFANQRPNHDFSLAFDIDVIKTYDEFDRAEVAAYQPEPEKPGKWPMNRRAYELSCVGAVPDKAPYRAPFRELCNRLQICGGDIARTEERYYREDVVTAADRAAFASRAQRAWTWIRKHAPDDFRYTVHRSAFSYALSSEQQLGIAALRRLIEETDLEAIDPKDLNQLIYDRSIHGANCENKAFFSAIYQKLIGRDQGPRLPGFLKEIGKERILELI